MTYSVVPLRSVANVVRGVTYKKEQARNRATTGHVPLLRATNIGDSLDLNNGLLHVPEPVVNPSQRLQLGDIVLASSSGSLSVVGKSAMLRDAWDGTFGAFCAVIRSSSRVDARYLSLYLRSHTVRSRWSAAARGTSINNLKRGDLEETPIPVPPLDEQRRIVDILEDHLSRLHAADADVAEAAVKATALRWTVLASALREVEGEIIRLGELASVKNGIYVSRPQTEPNGVPILRIGAVRPLALDLRDLRYSAMPEADIAAVGGLLQAGDLVFTRYNGNPQLVGACAVVTDVLLPLTYPDKLIRVRADAGRVTADFLAAVCSVGPARDQIQAAVKTTAGQAGISGRDLKAVAISIPGLEDQRRIVQLAASVAGSVHRLKEAVGAASARSSSLRGSLLSAAFSGRLTGSSSDLDRVMETGMTVPDFETGAGEPISG